MRWVKAELFGKVKVGEDRLKILFSRIRKYAILKFVLHRGISAK